MKLSNGFFFSFHAISSPKVGYDSGVISSLTTVLMRVISPGPEAVTDVVLPLRVSHINKVLPFSGSYQSGYTTTVIRDRYKINIINCAETVNVISQLHHSFPEENP